MRMCFIRIENNIDKMFRFAKLASYKQIFNSTNDNRIGLVAIIEKTSKTEERRTQRTIKTTTTRTQRLHIIHFETDTNAFVKFIAMQNAQDFFFHERFNDKFSVIRHIPGVRTKSQMIETIAESEPI